MSFIGWVTALLAGAILGVFFFGSLWFTVRQLPTTGWPAQLVVVSYFGRMAIAFLGFYLIMQGDWQRAIVGLLGFIITRFLFVRRLRPTRRQLSQSVG
jgi:F1F0 ATPase subunit 2